MNHPIPDTPGFRRTIHIYPTGQIAAIKKWNKVVVAGRRCSDGCKQHNQNVSFHAMTIAPEENDDTQNESRADETAIQARHLSPASDEAYQPREEGYDQLRLNDRNIPDKKSQNNSCALPSSARCTGAERASALTRDVLWQV